MVLPTFTLRAFLALSTLALPIFTLPIPIHKSGHSIAKRAVAHHVSELDSNWDDADSWEPHSGWYSYNEDSADWNDDDYDDDDDDDGEWDVEEYDYDNDYDYEHDNDEDYNDYDEEWDYDDEDEGEWDDEEEDKDDEGEWESNDEDDDEDGQVYYSDNPSPAKPASYSPHHVVHSGIGTVYAQDGYAGSCGNHHDDSAFIAALGNSWMHHQYEASECGRQIQVTNKGSQYHVGGKGNTITVTIQDTCASCGDGHVDFSHAAWDALTDGSPHGQIDLEWTWL